MILSLCWIVTESHITQSSPRSVRTSSSSSVASLGSKAFLTAVGGALLRSQPANAQSMVKSTNIVTAPLPNLLSVANENKKDDESLLNGLISGAATRVSKELLLHPLDTVRARQQIATTTPEFTRDINNQKGLYEGLYDGIQPALLGGVPAGALFFGIKDLSKRKLKKLGLNKEQVTIASVALANVAYWVVRNPAG